MNSMLMTRWVLVAVSAALAIVLLSRGDTLIGGFLGVMVVARIAMLVQVRRRRERFRRRVESRRGRWRAGSGPGTV